MSENSGEKGFKSPAEHLAEMAEETFAEAKERVREALGHDMPIDENKLKRMVKVHGPKVMSDFGASVTAADPTKRRKQVSEWFRRWEIEE